jgi:hypothetical protein
MVPDGEDQNPFLDSYMVDTNGSVCNRSLSETALTYRRAGLSVLPANASDKYPTNPKWKPYQKRLPTEHQITSWWEKETDDSVCVLTGSVSGNVHMIDFDYEAELFDAWAKRVDEFVPGLMGRLFIERSQRGGKHVVYRIDGDVPKTTELAKRVMPCESGDEFVYRQKTVKPKKNDQGDWQATLTMIETRGEGGLFLCAPSPGYVVEQGSLADLPTLTEEEHNAIIYAAESFSDELPQAFPQAFTESPSTNSGELLPGHDYNARGDFDNLLRSHGWSFVRMSGPNQLWRRPGKSKGVSATFHTGLRLFYVFTTSTELDGGKAYSPWRVYAFLEHGGDFEAAAAELRDLGYGSKPVSVDLSFFHAGETFELDDDPGPIDSKLLEVPGFIADVMAYTLATAPRPNKALAFGGALALMSTLTGRRVKTAGGLRPNIYLLALADSGCGKDHPRKVNVSILTEIKRSYWCCGRFASGEGLEDHMARRKLSLFQTDEIDAMLQSISRSKDGRNESMLSAMLEFHSSAQSVFAMRKKAGCDEGENIPQPHLVLFGTATPENYFSSLNEKMLVGGFLGRTMIVEAGERGPRSFGREIEPPPGILAIAEWWRDQGNEDDLTKIASIPSPRTIEATADAAAILMECAKIEDVEHAKARQSRDQCKMAVFARFTEGVERLALIYACSVNHEQPEITADAANWGRDFMLHQTRRMLAKIKEHNAESPFHADCLKLLQKLKAAPGKKLTHTALSRKMPGHSPKDFKTLIESLAEKGRIEITEEPTGGRPIRTYCIR